MRVFVTICDCGYPLSLTFPYLLLSLRFGRKAVLLLILIGRMVVLDTSSVHIRKFQLPSLKMLYHPLNHLWPNMAKVQYNCCVGVIKGENCCKLLRIFPSVHPCVHPSIRLSLTLVLQDLGLLSGFCSKMMLLALLGHWTCVLHFQWNMPVEEFTFSSRIPYLR